MKTYVKRVGGSVVERVENVRPGQWRDEELSKWVSIREQIGLPDGWYLEASDGDDGSGHRAQSPVTGAAAAAPADLLADAVADEHEAAPTADEHDPAPAPAGRKRTAARE